MAKSTYTKGNLYQISCETLQADPNQPRKYIDTMALQELVESIKQKGVIQPILFRVEEDGSLYIVSGERRYQAAKEAGLENIPGILIEGNYSEIAIIENLLRQDLTAVELAEALDRTMKEYSYTQTQLSSIICKAESTVSEILTLMKLPESVRDECRVNPSISRNALLKIAKKKRDKAKENAFKKYKEKLEKEPLKRGPKGQRKSFQDRFAEKSSALFTSVTKTQIEKLDNATRKGLISKIEELKKAADKLIGQIKATPVAEPMPKKAEKKPAAKPKKESKGKTAAKPAKKK